MKGQIISIDALVSITIFIVLVSFLLFFGSMVEYRASNIEDTRLSKEVLVEVSDTLITTPGDPVFWGINNTDIKSFGLAYKDHILSSDKIYRFQTEADGDYNNFRRVLGTGKFDVYVELLTLDYSSNCTLTSNDNEFNLTAGKSPDGSNVLSISRIVKTDDSEFCRLRLWLWE